MEYRQLGTRGPVVSTIGYGTWPIGGKGYGPVDDDVVVQAVRRALDLGITLFDTAPAYGGGYAETFLGRVLAGQRDRVVLITKGGLSLDDSGRIIRRDSRAESLIRGLDESLQRLRMENVDVFLIHWPDRQATWEDAVTGLEQILASGKARYVGVSNFRSSEFEFFCRHTPIVTNQVAYNLFDRRWEAEVFPTARTYDVGIAAYSPLAHGLLSGHYRPDHRFAAGDWRSTGRNLSSPDVLVGENFQHNLGLVERLRDLAQEHRMTVAQLALAWVLRDPLVATAITSPRRIDHVIESAGAAGPRLTDDDLVAIDKIATTAAGLVVDLPE